MFDFQVCEIANCALDLRNAVATRYAIPHKPEKKLQIRMGLHSGMNYDFYS